MFFFSAIRIFPCSYITFNYTLKCSVDSSLYQWSTVHATVTCGLTFRLLRQPPSLFLKRKYFNSYRMDISSAWQLIFLEHILRSGMNSSDYLKRFCFSFCLTDVPKGMTLAGQQSKHGLALAQWYSFLGEFLETWVQSPGLSPQKEKKREPRGNLEPVGIEKGDLGSYN